MINAERALHTIGVFQDLAWADRGVRALLASGFSAATVSVLALTSTGIDPLIRAALAAEPHQIDVRNLGSATYTGPLVSALAGRDSGLSSVGLAAAFRRVGFQAHDGYIFETLVGRGGVLAGVESTARAADALARLHAYGAGNAAIGAWTGRV